MDKITRMPPVLVRGEEVSRSHGTALRELLLLPPTLTFSTARDLAELALEAAQGVHNSFPRIGLGPFRGLLGLPQRPESTIKPPEPGALKGTVWEEVALFTWEEVNSSNAKPGESAAEEIEPWRAKQHRALRIAAQFFVHHQAYLAGNPHVLAKKMPKKKNENPDSNHLPPKSQYSAAKFELSDQGFLQTCVDGQVLKMGPVRAEHIGELREAYVAMDPDDVNMRFFAPLVGEEIARNGFHYTSLPVEANRDLLPELAKQWEKTKPKDHIDIVLVDDKGSVCSIATGAIFGDAREKLELSVIVFDKELRGRKLAQSLLSLLAMTGYGLGTSQLYALTHRENRGVHNAIRGCFRNVQTIYDPNGGPLEGIEDGKFDDGDLIFTLSLPETNALWRGSSADVVEQLLLFSVSK